MAKHPTRSYASYAIILTASIYLVVRGLDNMHQALQAGSDVAFNFAKKYLNSPDVTLTISRTEQAVSLKCRNSEPSMYLAIDQQSGVVLESSGGFYHPVQPRPILTFAAVIDDLSQPWRGLPTNLQFGNGASLLLLEDQFDAVTRTRRGRLFEAWPSQPSEEYMAADRRAAVWKYQQPSGLLNSRKRAPLRYLALGSSEFASLWRVVAMEYVGGGDLLLTLRSVEMLGVVPDLNEQAVPPESLNRLKEALQRLADNAYRQPPEALVDNCRAVLTICLAHYVHDRDATKGALTKDLGDLAKLLRSLAPPVKEAAASIADVVARLHARVKPNVQVEFGVKAPTVADAELALQGVGLVLRDFGWARSS